MALLTIGQKADTVGTFRFIAVFLMETFARWTPLVPELEVKVLLGRHLWEFAQHADVLGGRTAELRASLHYTRPPARAYQDALEALARLEGSAERVQGAYDILIPDLARRYEAELAGSDRLLDQPSIRLFERILADLARLGVERQQMLAGMAIPAPAPDWSRPLTAALAAADGFVDFRPVKEGAA